jgi:hypothetical protein
MSSCRFFTYYHPFIRVILHPSSPDDTYDQSHYLFWAICSIGARPRPEHPVPRARTGDLCVELGKEVKSLFCQILGERCRTHKAVQALILICEFPFARPQGRDGFIWVCRSRFNAHIHSYVSIYLLLVDIHRNGTSKISCIPHHAPPYAALPRSTSPPESHPCSHLNMSSF